MARDEHLLWLAMGDLHDHFGQLGGAARYPGMQDSELPLYIAATLVRRLPDAPHVRPDTRMLAVAPNALDVVNRRLAAVTASGDGLRGLLREFCMYADSRLPEGERSRDWIALLSWLDDPCFQRRPSENL